MTRRGLSNEIYGKSHWLPFDSSHLPFRLIRTWVPPFSLYAKCPSAVVAALISCFLRLPVVTLISGSLWPPCGIMRKEQVKDASPFTLKLTGLPFLTLTSVVG